MTISYLDGSNAPSSAEARANAALLQDHAAQYGREQAALNKGGPPDGQLIFKCGGQSVTGWTTVGVTVGIDRVPGSFDIRATPRYPGELRDLVPLNAPATISIGGHVVLTGYFERATTRLSRDTHTVGFVGRGRCCDLVDCAALLSNQTRTLTSIGTLARELVRPFAGPIQVLTPDGDGDGKLFTFTINLGEAPYDIIERIARYEGLLTYENFDGNLVLSRVGKVKHASGFVEGQNVQSAEIRNTADERFSVYIPLLMAADTLTRDGSVAGGGNAAGNRVTDPFVTRYRPRIIVSEQATNDGPLAYQRALWEAIHRAGRSLIVTIVCDSWLDSAGTPWTPNHVVPFSLPSIGLGAPDWIIVDVHFGRNGAEGTTARVTLMAPEALTVEPSAFNAMDARRSAQGPTPGGGGPTGPAATAAPGPPTAANAQRDGGRGTA